MKGPLSRTKYNIGRLWECPECCKRIFTSGAVVSRACECGNRLIPERTIWMKLVEENPVRLQVEPKVIGEVVSDK